MEERGMDYLSHNIAINLKHARKSKGISLDVVAEQTGVSKSMLAQIEKGQANPSIGVLGKIASGLRISFNDLLRAPRMDTYLVKVNQTAPTKEVPGQYRVWTCFPYEDNGMVEIYQIDIEPGGIYVSGSHGEHTREYISMRQGTLTIQINETHYEITTEDIFRFEFDQIHRYLNKTPEKISFICYFVDYT